ncbi:MAG: chemotaxis protein CheW [Polyangiaceae bacterium]
MALGHEILRISQGDHRCLLLGRASHPPVRSDHAVAVDPRGKGFFSNLLVDVRARVNLPEIDYHDRTCIIVVEVGGKSVGLVVDAVSEVLAIDESQIEPPPDFRAGKTAQYISGMAKVEDSVKVLLDADKLLAMDDLDTTGRRASA